MVFPNCLKKAFFPLPSFSVYFFLDGKSRQFFFINISVYLWSYRPLKKYLKKSFR